MMAIAAEYYIPQLHSIDESLYPPKPSRQPQTPKKDYSIPLHVDCSVEYELPDCAKPPQGVKIEPLLMIHPAHFRRLDSLRRCPFVNNLPAASGGGGGRLPFDLPPPAPAPAPAARPACLAPYSVPKMARAAKPQSTYRVQESPKRDRWTTTTHRVVAKNLCCKGVVQYNKPECAVPESVEPYPYWSGGMSSGGALYAPKEGDTLENSGFGKCAVQKCRSARQKTHPYVIDSSVLAGGNTAIAQNCDKTLEMLQGNRLISPFHAKMFSSENVYQNYPIVMYK